MEYGNSTHSIEKYFSLLLNLILNTYQVIFLV